MAEAWFELSPAERREVLELAAAASGRPRHLLEKDIWVVWSLEQLFGNPIGGPLVFKGGTSLSKAHHVIRRFSEDVDLTYDIRRLIPALVGETPDAIPPNTSQERKWSKEVRQHLDAWVAGTAVPFLATALEATAPEGEIRVEGAEIYIRYAALAPLSDYVRPEVKLEFGGRATGEPSNLIPVSCDAAPFVEGVAFPQALPRVMTAERTFWEKATAAHVYCLKGNFRGDRYARHWYDLVRLSDSGHAGTALADRYLARTVALHKGMFFREKDADSRPIDYTAAVSGQLKLVPDGAARSSLADDYARMIDDGLLMDTPPAFDELMEVCRLLEMRAREVAFE